MVRRATRRHMHPIGIDGNCILCKFQIIDTFLLNASFRSVPLCATTTCYAALEIEKESVGARKGEKIDTTSRTP